MENFKHLPEPFRIRNDFEPETKLPALIVKKQLLNPV